MQFSRIDTTLDNLTRRFVAERAGDHWEGKLSSSALSTATATVALTLAHRRDHNARYEELAVQGAAWLARTQNEDGGWGDTPRSLSNISTSALCWAALKLCGPQSGDSQQAQQRATGFMKDRAGGLDPNSLTRAIRNRYGKDRTFSVPILTVLAIADLIGEAGGGWRRVPQLPFELAALPQHWYGRLRLPVVSYALPALIAIGQARHSRQPTRNPITRVLRNTAREKTLRRLEEIQPVNGGFLEATPLTSFVTMSLIVARCSDHTVVRKGLTFIEESVRPDGSWPIDTNLATWVTTLGINALASRPDFPDILKPTEREMVGTWLAELQLQQEHPYTGAAPGGWAWTNRPGGVPDADDTAGALLALKSLGGPRPNTSVAAQGVRWLLDLQNTDGGVPTFCRGWGALPFDRSSPDITAHALRAWWAWYPDLPPDQQGRIGHATSRAIRYLRKSQHADGSWAPLWFGNEGVLDDVNFTYGTAKVLSALAVLPEKQADSAMLEAAEAWLLDAQKAAGGWGGAAGVSASIEETALAVSALGSRQRRRTTTAPSRTLEAIYRGTDWLIQATDEGRVTEPSPIGFYFAKLWYFEQLYPLIYSLDAFGQVAALLQPEGEQAKGSPGISK